MMECIMACMEKITMIVNIMRIVILDLKNARNIMKRNV